MKDSFAGTSEFHLQMFNRILLIFLLLQALVCAGSQKEYQKLRNNKGLAPIAFLKSKGNVRTEVTLRSISGYVRPENSYHYVLGIVKTNNMFKSMYLKLKRGKEYACKHSFNLKAKEQKALDFAIQGLRFCKKESPIAEMLYDIPRNTIEFISPAQKYTYDRKKVLSGTSPHLCGGQERLYLVLNRILETKKSRLLSCPDHGILLQ